MHYRIGLDIGIGSVGWAVLEDDPITGAPVRIEKMGVRVFEANEVPKTGASAAESRRIARGIRRRGRRKKFRMQRLSSAFNKYLGVDCKKSVNELLNEDVYKLRSDALDRLITDEELAKVVWHIFKRRGFKSSRKSLSAKEDGLLLKAVERSKERLEESGYRTVGEMLYKDSNYKAMVCGHTVYDVRNHGGDWRNCFMRESLSDELKQILNAQMNLGNTKIVPEFIERVIEIFESQRNFDEGPAKGRWHTDGFNVGNCTFLTNEPRAPKASYTFELFNALKKINDLKIDGESLTLEQKDILYQIVKTEKELKFDKVRKVLNVGQGKLFNLCNYRRVKKSENLTEDEIVKKNESVVFVSMGKSYEIRKAVFGTTKDCNTDIVDELAQILSLNKSDDRINTAIKDSALVKDLNEEQIEKVKNIDAKYFGSLSIKAMKLIIEQLNKGLRYDKACLAAGFNHSSFEHEKQKYLNGDFVENLVGDINNNVVKRSVRQTLKVVNEIIKNYGSPQFVMIELARELSKTHKERKELKSSQDNRKDENERIYNILQTELGVNHPSGQDILKYKLYLEQDCKSMYSGAVIDLARLFEPNYVQIDHVLPISKSYDDSYNNKVLVLTCENQNKGDRIPFEYFGNNEQQWLEFEARVNQLNNLTKRRNLLKKKFDEEDQKEFKSRNLNDTSYIAKLLLEAFKNNLATDDSVETVVSKKRVNSINGAVTNYLRKCWAINKIREDGDIHHAVDACVIAVATDGEVQKVTANNKLKEKFYKTPEGGYISKTTGVLMTKSEKEQIEAANIALLSNKIPEPYENFTKELKIRSVAKYDNFSFTEQEKLELSKIGYTEAEIDRAKPVFVSRMKTVKRTGAIHSDTIMSTRDYKTTGKLIKSVKLSKLKLSNKPETVKLKDDPDPTCSIVDYYRPQNDRLLYLKIKKHLIENGKIDSGETFYKPRKDGTDGPIVKSVKVYEKSSSFVKTANGGASNSDMYRIDVFKKEDGYYFIPVYYADVYRKKLPNKVVIPSKDWLPIDKSYQFVFSLYKNDLIRIKKSKPLTMQLTNDKSNKAPQIENTEMLCYFNSANISTASLKLYSHDKCYEASGIGIKSLPLIEKCYVDVMGKVYNATKETRKPL